MVNILKEKKNLFLEKYLICLVIKDIKYFFFLDMEQALGYIITLGWWFDEYW